MSECTISIRNAAAVGSLGRMTLWLTPDGTRYYTGSAPAGFTLVSTTTTSTNRYNDNFCEVTVSSAPANSLIVATLGHGSDGGQARDITGVSGTTMGSFSKVTGTAGNNWARASIWYKTVGGSSVTNEVITWTHNATITTNNTIRVLGAYVFTGQHASPIGTSGTGDNNTPAAISITPQASGSYIILALGQDSGASTFVANANTTIDKQAIESTLQAAATMRSTSKTPNTSAISIGATNTGLSNQILAVEIKSA